MEKGWQFGTTAWFLLPAGALFALVVEWVWSDSTAPVCALTIVIKNMGKQTIGAILFDLSGVLYVDNDLVEGAVETVAEARKRGLTVRFVTNTATRGFEEIMGRLHGFGFDAAEEELFTAPAAAKQLIVKKGWRPYCLIHDAIKPDFADLDQNDPNCVVIGDARDELNYESLNKAFRVCQDGAPLIGIGMNRYFEGPDGLQMDAGPFIRAVAWASNIEPIVMGKPGGAFFDEVVASTSFAPGECLMIGDDAEADVGGAMHAGLQGCLVRTGKFQPGDEQVIPEGAEVIDSVADLFS